MSVTPKRGLRFLPATHRYTLHGAPIPGVTTLLSGGIPKPALPNWAAKSVAEWVVQNFEETTALVEADPAQAVRTLKGVPWVKRDAAAVKGSEIHALAERIIHGESVEVPGPLVDHVAGYVAFLDAFDVQPIVTERPCYNEKWFYAGTFDAVVSMPYGDGDRQTWLVDWKSSTGVYGETACQTAAYAMAEKYLDADGEEHPMPPIDRIGVVHITANGSRLYDLGDISKAFAEFRSAAYVAKTADRRKQLIGQPLTPEGISA